MVRNHLPGNWGRRQWRRGGSHKAALRRLRRKVAVSTRATWWMTEPAAAHSWSAQSARS